MKRFVLAMVSCAFALMLAGCAGGQQPASSESQQGAPSDSASSSASSDDARIKELEEEARNIKQFLDGKWYGDFTKLMDEAAAEAGGAEKGEYQTLMYYSNKAKEMADNFPEYKGTDQNLQRFYAAYKAASYAYALSLNNLTLSAQGVAMNDRDMAKRYMLEADDAMKNVTEMVETAKSVMDEIAREHESLTGNGK